MAQSPRAQPPDWLLPALGPSGEWTDFFRGLAVPFRSLKLLVHSRRLLALSLTSGLVTAAALGGLVVLLSRSTGDLVGQLWARPDTWYGIAVWYLLVATSFLVLLVVAANTVPLVLLAPLQDPLSEATEVACGGFQPEGFSVAALVRSTGLSILHTVHRVSWLLFGHLLLAATSFVPGVGSLIWTAGGTLWTSWWLAGEYLSIPMARWMYPFGEVRQALRARRALALGFGTAVHLLLWLPVLNFFFVHLAIIGGTLLFRSLRAAGHIGEPPAPTRLPRQSLDEPSRRD